MHEKRLDSEIPREARLILLLLLPREMKHASRNVRMQRKVRTPSLVSLTLEHGKESKAPLPLEPAID